MKIAEVTNKPPTPEQLRIKNLAATKDRAADALAAADAELPIDAYESSEDDYTMPIVLGIGALVIVGGGVYFMSGSRGSNKAD